MSHVSLSDSATASRIADRAAGRVPGGNKSPGHPHNDIGQRPVAGRGDSHSTLPRTASHPKTSPHTAQQLVTAHTTQLQHADQTTPASPNKQLTLFFFPPFQEKAEH